MAQTNVLFIWKVRDELKEYLQQGLSKLNDVKLIFLDDVSEDKLLIHAPEVQILVGWRPSRDLLDTAIQFRLFINPGVGVQHHLETFRDLTKTRDVILINGHGNTYFTAQHAVALLLSVTNKIIPHHMWMKEGQWRKGDTDAKSIPLRDRQIGLLGYGAVNSKVHKFLSGFDIGFHICRRSWTEDHVTLPTPVKKYTTSEIHEFLKEIDTLIVGVPQTPETIGLIGTNELDLLGERGLVITVGRGLVIDEESFYKALIEKRIAGAGIDVWYQYRPQEDAEGRKYPSAYPFHDLDNVVLSPHRGASPMDDLKRWDEVIENITRFAQGQDDFINVVDLERGY
ncbi:MAG: NAD(P)-dependent oxidoreductase [Candidatus Thorarchaeota archaeon]|jgi:phosphoglycerate dehydrogenase-like enzyme